MKLSEDMRVQLEFIGKYVRELGYSTTVSQVRGRLTEAVITTEEGHVLGMIAVGVTYSEITEELRDLWRK